MVYISNDLSDAFQGPDIFEVKYLKNGASYGLSYYRTLMWNYA